MFKKLLIANRGEIAVRIIRAARELGIQTVAIYSEADKDSLHTMLADEAICIGPAKSTDSYLNMNRVLSAAIVTEAQAIHPGFGFLSENSKFATLCEEMNIKFIGPSGEIMDKMGDKINARAIAVGITALATVMLFGYSVASAPWHIYLLAALSGTIITAGARLFVSVIITNWFNLKRGFAVSLALCGSAFGGAILSPIVGNIIATSGWRFAFVVLAVICLVGSLPIAVIFFRSHPSDKGQQPYGAELTEDQI